MKIEFVEDRIPEKSYFDKSYSDRVYYFLLDEKFKLEIIRCEDKTSDFLSEVKLLSVSFDNKTHFSVNSVLIDAGYNPIALSQLLSKFLDKQDKFLFN